MVIIPPIDDAYVDSVIKSAGAYNPTLIKTQGIQLRELFKLMRDRMEQGDLNVLHTIGDEAISGMKSFNSGLGTSLLNFNNGSSYVQVSSGQLTASRLQTLQDKNGVIALVSDLGNYLPLSGGSMTGNIQFTDQEGTGIRWDRYTDYSKIFFESINAGDPTPIGGTNYGRSNLVFLLGDDGYNQDHFVFRYHQNDANPVEQDTFVISNDYLYMRKLLDGTSDQKVLTIGDDRKIKERVIGRGSYQIMAHNENGDTNIGRTALIGVNNGASDDVYIGVSCQLTDGNEANTISKGARMQLGNSGDILFKTFTGPGNGTGNWSDRLRIRNTSGTLDYSADVSANYNSRSLVDKAYVDSKVLDPDDLRSLGAWNALTNTPALTTTPAPVGKFYEVSVAGTQSVTGSVVIYSIGDRLVSNGITWQYVAYSAAYATKAEVLRLTPYDYQTPAADAVVNNLSTINDSGVFPSNILIVPTDNRAVTSGYISKFRIRLTNAESGRKVHFFILREISANNFTLIYDSGDVLMEAAGVNTYSPTYGSIHILANDCIGARVVYTSSANGMSFSSNQLATSVTLPATATVGGGPYTGAAQPTSRKFPIEATVVATLLLPTAWANKTDGWLKLNADGLVTSTQLPVQLSGSESHTETPVEVYLQDKKSNAIQRASGGVENYNFGNSVNGAGGNAGYNFGNRVIVTTLTDTQGFLRGGVLNEVRVAPVTGNVATSKIQAWVVRLINGVFQLVDKVGEIDASVANRWHVFKGLSIFVKKGDFIAIRGIDCNLQYWGGSTAQRGYQSWINLQTAAPDLSMDGLNNGVVPIATINTSTPFNYEATISDGYIGAKNVAGASVGLNASTQIPNNIGRTADMYWQGKTIVYVGTSIPAGNSATGGSAGAGVSYPMLAGTALDASMDNQSVGSSGIIWDGSRNLSLSATVAELTAAFGAGSAIQSYETKMLGKGADLFVFDHGYNDRLQASGARLGTLPWTTRTGTITTNTASTAINGVNTLFTTEFKVGDKVYDINTNFIGKVGVISSNVSMTLVANAITAISNIAYLGTSMDRTTYYGAFNYVVDKCYEENPLVSIAFITPPNLYGTNGTEVTAINNVRTTIIALANSYAAPHLDLMRELNYNPANWKLRTIDGTHPKEDERPRIGNILYNFLKGVS